MRLAGVTWSFDPDSGRSDVLASAPVGLDTLVTTPHGVLGVNKVIQTKESGG